MIQKENGLIIFFCDGCPEYIETDTEDFHDALDTIKRNEWRVTKDAEDEWIHLCSVCA
jgi:hypothetical protein